ncbi:MAG: RHS repeat-associated core domain-containing protein [Streptosporangiaceae bacterium]|nr:RHS repeat-associated core domain-containing protein [Streptosporangiaceae bacterium]
MDSTAQNPAWRQFTPYGAPRGQAVTWADNRGYLNKPADAATGLTILGARQYDPVTGQFISPDPVLNPADPQDLDAYSYAEDNPVTYADPTGLCRLADPGGPPVNCSGQPVPVSGTPAPQNQDPTVYDPAPPSTGCSWFSCAWHAVAGAGSWLGNQGGASLLGGIGNGIYDTISAVPSMFAQLFNQMFDAFPTGATADGQLTFGNNSHVSVPHSPWHIGNPGSIAYKIGYYAWPLLVPAAAPEEGAAEASGTGLARALAPKVTAYAHTTPGPTPADIAVNADVSTAPGTAFVWTVFLKK